MYDLIVIGAGSGGLTAVQFAARLGAKVALVEKDRVGGDCTWTGCVPSKALLHVAKTFQAARQVQRFGVDTGPITADMRKVKDAVQQIIQTFYEREAPNQLQAEGIDVFMGAAKFLDANRIQVGEQILEAKKYLITTGAQPITPPVEGIHDVPYLTYQQIFENDRLPDHLLVLGAGPVGMELGQAYGRLGAKVTVVDVSLLPEEEPEVAEVMAHVFACEGIAFVPGLVTAVVHQNNQFSLKIRNQANQSEQIVQGDMLLVAAGRKPNVNGLELEKAGVAFSEVGIQVNDNLQTSTHHIYAAGDCTGGHQFTHFAGWQAYKAVRNALLPGSSSGHSDIVPRVTFTDPEVAQVGLLAEAARERYGEKAVILMQPLADDDRAQTEGATAGFVKLIRHRDGRVLGATIVAPRAGEMIAEIALAMQHDLRLADIAHTIHPYPTYSSNLQMMASEQTMADFQRNATGKLMRRFVSR